MHYLIATSKLTYKELLNLIRKKQERYESFASFVSPSKVPPPKLDAIVGTAIGTKLPNNNTIELVRFMSSKTNKKETNKS